MSKTLECHVRLWGEEVGVLATIKGKIYFQYEDSFVKKGLQISPLHLPLGAKVYETTTLTHFEGLAGVFADVFNVLAGNQDDHAKNHSFVMNQKDVWKLSPAYDISPTFGYGHQMSINFKDKGVNEEDLLIMAEHFNIKDADKIIAEQKEVISHFDEYAHDIGISRKKGAEIMKHLKI